MIGYNSGDIVICPVLFTDQTISKVRPVVILAKAQEDYIVVPITSQLQQQQVHDVVISPSEENGIRIESVIKMTKFMTFSGEIFHKKLGEVGRKDRETIKESAEKFVKSW